MKTFLWSGARNKAKTNKDFWDKMETFSRFLHLLFLVLLCYDAQGSDAILDQVDVIDKNIQLLEDKIEEDDNISLSGFANFSSMEKKSIELQDEQDEGNDITCSFDDECANQFKLKDSRNKFEWKLMHSRRDMPDKLETNGRFLRAYIEKKHNRNEYGVFSSEEFEITNQRQCASFRYFMYNREGCDVARLSVILECAGQEEILFQESQQRGWKWIGEMLKIEKTPGTKCKLTWKAAKGLSDSGVVGVDQIEMYNEACPTNGVMLPSFLDCNFQNGLCDWKSTGAIDWAFSSGRTPSLHTGPHDAFEGHIHGSHVQGQYAFVDASFPNFEKSGILQSPTIWNERPRCLRVLVNMHGKYVGKFMITITSSTGTEEVFSKTGEQGEDWFEALIDLPVKEDFKVSIIGETMKSLEGDIAIDDIIVQNGMCKDLKSISSCDYSVDGDGNVQHPCYVVLPSGGCITNVVKDNVKNVAGVNTLRVQKETCDHKDFWTSVSIPKMRISRRMCFTFDYKITSGTHCGFVIYHVRKDPSKDDEDKYKTLKSHRLHDVDEGDIWSSYKTVFYTPVDKKDTDSVGIYFKPHHRCSDVSFANLRLTSGPCPLDG